MSLLDTRHKKKSFTLTTLLLSLLVLLLFYIGLTYMDPPEENGITVNFGTMEFGMGNQQPLEPVRRQQPEPEELVEDVPEEVAVSEPATEPATEPEVPEESTQAESPTEKVLTQENEESIRIRQREEARKKAEEAARKKAAEEARIKAEAQAEAERQERERQAAAERARQEQEAKKRELDAMMGGLNTSSGTAEGSEGDDNQAGDKGQPGGDPYATTYYGGPGSGSGTGGYGLGGRTLASKGQVEQQCNQAGRVVVQITVDRSGKVVAAQPGVRGTTNNDPCLLEPARKTAFMHRWNPDPNAPNQQIGFVVVNFKLGE
ncbi:energy transducer TonB [Robiginitalea sp. SC105]|uniref:energy transducer TonB n=1 Tax=Robiginitalea sp. SC105 TaxID=2762332 RepID=UPI0016398C2D|nr:energy transducer TonB [Robiginitalea sp. SC105]MBC2839504.1 energy transducer TonB [Robiginitalea sp. SC105]